MGMKPLYYFENKDYLIFSSTQSGIYNQEFFKKELNHHRLKEYIRDFSSDNTCTFFKDIYLIPSSSYIFSNLKKTQTIKYFEFDLNKKIDLKNDNEYAEATFEVFDKTISSIASSYRNYSSKLSGGLDSSSISSLLLRKYLPENKPLNCYSVVYEGLSYDELQYSDEFFYMNEVIKLGNANHIKVPIMPSGTSLIDSYNVAYETNEVLIPSYNRNLDYEIFKSMNLHNSRIIFDGFDGDSVISFGMEKFIKLIKHFKLISFFNERKKFANAHGLKFSYKESSKFLIKNRLPSLYNKLKNVNKLNQGFSKKNPINMTMQELHNEMVVDPSWQVSLEFTEEDATNNGIEEVFPFFDKDLMQYMISLPVEQKLHNGRSRYHFRNAMKDTVPSSILNRFSKANLSKMWIKYARNIPKEVMHEILLSNKYPLKDYLDHEYINDLISFNYEKLKITESFNSQKLVSLISLAFWIKKNHI